MEGLTKEKYLSKEEIKLFREHLYSQMLSAKSRGHTRRVRPYYILEFLLNSGLRVGEVCTLKFKDLNLNSRTPSVQVLNGKGGKDRIVYVPSDIRRLIDDYRNWKESIHEPYCDDDYVFISDRRKPYTTRAIQAMMNKVKSSIRVNCRCTPHSLRHSFAVYLYAQEKDLRLVQRQLGHSNINTTTVYADVTPESANRQVEKLWA